MSFTETIHVTCRPSTSLRIANVLAHAAALVVLVTLAFSRPAFGLLGLLVLVSGVHAECVLTRRRPGMPVYLRWSADHRLRWQDHAGRVHEGECIEAKSWGAAWVRLKMRASGRRVAHTIVIPRDAVDAGVHRQLRARCRVMPPGRRV